MEARASFENDAFGNHNFAILSVEDAACQNMALKEVFDQKYDCDLCEHNYC